MYVSAISRHVGKSQAPRACLCVSCVSFCNLLEPEQFHAQIAYLKTSSTAAAVIRGVLETGARLYVAAIMHTDRCPCAIKTRLD